MTPNTKKLKTTMNTPSESLSIRGSPSHSASRKPLTPKLTPNPGNVNGNMAAQRDQGDDTSMEGDRETLGYFSNEDDTVKARKDAEKDNMRKYSSEEAKDDRNLDSEDHSCSSAPEYYDTSEIDDDDDDRSKDITKDDDDEQEEEEEDRWDLDYSKSNHYSDWLNNAMINDYTTICVKNQLLYADILKHIRKRMQNSVDKEDPESFCGL